MPGRHKQRQQYQERKVELQKAGLTPGEYEQKVRELLSGLKL